MIERNKGDTEELGLRINLDVNQASRFKNALIRILDKVEIQTGDQVQQEDIKEIFRLLDYFSERKNSK